MLVICQCILLFNTCCLSPVLLQATEQAKEEMKKVMSVLNQHLNTRTFLVGERVSLADVSVVCSMLWLYKQVRMTFSEPPAHTVLSSAVESLPFYIG